MTHTETRDPDGGSPVNEPCVMTCAGVVWTEREGNAAARQARAEGVALHSLAWFEAEAKRRKVVGTVSESSPGEAWPLVEITADEYQALACEVRARPASRTLPITAVVMPGGASPSVPAADGAVHGVAFFVDWRAHHAKQAARATASATPAPAASPGAPCAAADPRAAVVETGEGWAALAAQGVADAHALAWQMQIERDELRDTLDAMTADRDRILVEAQAHARELAAALREVARLRAKIAGAVTLSSTTPTPWAPKGKVDVSGAAAAFEREQAIGASAGEVVTTPVGASGQASGNTPAASSATASPSVAEASPSATRSPLAWADLPRNTEATETPADHVGELRDRLRDALGGAPLHPAISEALGVEPDPQPVRGFCPECFRYGGDHRLGCATGGAP